MTTLEPSETDSTTHQQHPTLLLSISAFNIARCCVDTVNSRLLGGLGVGRAGDRRNGKTKSPGASREGIVQTAEPLSLGQVSVVCDGGCGLCRAAPC